MSLTLPDLLAMIVFLAGSLFLYLTVKEESGKSAAAEHSAATPFRCPICAYIYASWKDGAMSSCPRCGTINREEDACFR